MLNPLRTLLSYQEVNFLNFFNEIFFGHLPRGVDPKIENPQVRSGYQKINF
jgi:hypothetical protein